MAADPRDVKKVQWLQWLGSCGQVQHTTCYEGVGTYDRFTGVVLHVHAVLRGDGCKSRRNERKTYCIFN